MKRIIICLLVVNCLFIKKTTAQNLVPNSSFEKINSWDTNAVSIYSFYYWQVPNNDNGTPDGFENDSNGIGNSDPCQRIVGQNTFIGNAYTNSGNHFLGLVCYYPQGGGWDSRENVMVKLTDSLQTDKQYKVGFYIKFANLSRYITNHLGLKLSDTILSCGSNKHLISVTPTVEHATPLGDSAGWTQVETLYTATGGEKFVTLGCFYPDSLLQVSINPLSDTTVNCLFLKYAGYYFFDSVYVIPVNAATTSSIQVNNGVSIYPNPFEQEFSIELKPNNTIQSMQLYNQLGQPVLFELNKRSKNKATIVAPSNIHGLLFVKVVDETNTVQVYKMYKQ